MTTTETDRGMRAVARVRSVRERDSRLGLQMALSEHRRHQSTLDQLRERLDAAPVWTSGDAASFLVLRRSMENLGRAVTDAQQAVDAAIRISETAHAHWTQDRTRLRAVELLLERRAEERRAEQARREARELDDISAQLWSRGVAERSAREGRTHA